MNVRIRPSKLVIAGLLTIVAILTASPAYLPDKVRFGTD